MHCRRLAGYLYLLRKVTSFTVLCCAVIMYCCKIHGIIKYVNLYIVVKMNTYMIVIKRFLYTAHL